MDIARLYKPRPYPSHQKSPGIEEVFAKESHNLTRKGWVHYQPRWTANETAIRELPKLIKKLSGIKSWYWKHQNQRLKKICAKHDKVFTVIQHDNGVQLAKHMHAPNNLIVFSSGGTGDLPLPLLCDKREAPGTPRRDLLVSFKGAITHHRHNYPFREVMLDAFKNCDDARIVDTNQPETTSSEDYIDLMKRSVFALCPRGYGKTSYRLLEAFQHGAIPIYVHDGDPWLPYTDKVDWNQISIIIDYRNLDTLQAILSKVSKETIEGMVQKGAQIYKEYLNVEYAQSYVREKLNAWSQWSSNEIRSECKRIRLQFKSNYD